jgi:hypothetical protein
MTMGRREARRRFDAVWSARQQRIERYNERERTVTMGHAWLSGREMPNKDDYHAAVEQMAAERARVIRTLAA